MKITKFYIENTELIIIYNFKILKNLLLKSQ